MELKPGYKQTEVGVIPEDWDVIKLGRYAAFRTGPFGSALHKSDYVNDGVPVINPMQIVDGKIIPTRTMAITQKATQELAEFQLHKGNIVIGRRGEMGRCAVVGREQDGWLCGTGSMIIKLSSTTDPGFVQRILSSPAIVSAIENTSVGSTMININQATLANLSVPMPTKLEQQRIAEALSDADALIEGLGKLISKKRQLKQGAMNELLSPKEGWVQTELGELCNPSKERFNPLTSAKERRCVELEHISSETGLLLGYFSTNDLRSQKSVFRKGDVLFGKLRPYLKKFWLASFDGVCSTELWVLKASPKIHSGWLYWLVQTNQIVDAANKSTGTKMPRAEWGTVKETEVFVPPDISEQISTAAVLSDMDAEIAGLEVKLAKARRVKEGMMQDLLTGKVRLV